MIGEKTAERHQIGRDELDALSVGSFDKSDEGSSDGDEDDYDSGSNNGPMRCSKRRKFILPAVATAGQKEWGFAAAGSFKWEGTTQLVSSDQGDITYANIS